MTGPPWLRFRERMRGWVSFDEDDYNTGLVSGRRTRTRCTLDVTVEIADLDRFLADPHRSAVARGAVDCPQLGGRLTGAARAGGFAMFVPAPDARRSEIRYRLFLEDPEGRPLTLSGVKLVQQQRHHSGWRDTTRLLVRILGGHVAPGGEDDAPLLAVGVLRVSVPSLLRTLLGMRGRPRLRGPARYQRTFLRRLWAVYRAPEPDAVQFDFPPAHRGAAPARRVEVVPFRTPDGCELNLHHLPGRKPLKPVLVVCGLAMRANCFYGGPGRTFADALLDAGYDVWLENWRTSIDLPQRDFTLDEAALFDHPAAVAKIRERTGCERFAAVAHCMGSASLTMSVLAGLVPELERVVASAVSLYLDLAWLSRMRLALQMPVLRLFMDGVDPQWTARSPTPATALFGAAAARSIRGYANPLTAAAAFCFGGTRDALMRPENVASPATQDWIAREFGYASFRTFAQVRDSARAGHFVTTGRYADLPSDLLEPLPPSGTAFTFVAGAANRFFLPDGQRRTYEHFAARQPGVHSFMELEGYAHVDTFAGDRASTDVFPRLVAAL